MDDVIIRGDEVQRSLEEYPLNEETIREGVIEVPMGYKGVEELGWPNALIKGIRS